MAKGGRMSTGHMVEVKLNTYIGVAGQAIVGPQHPILYYVHKRPHCDEFLRRVRSTLPGHEEFTQMLSGLQMV
jgi:CTD nuclear envelope phosphatase 1